MTAVTFLAVITALWLAHSWWFPRRPCRACHGTRHGTGSTRRSWNHCHWCGNSGEQIRVGARLVAAATRRPPRHTPTRRR